MVSRVCLSGVYVGKEKGLQFSEDDWDKHAKGY